MGSLKKIAWLSANWGWLQFVVYFIGVAILIGAVIGGIQSCRRNSAFKKDQENKAKAEQIKGRIQEKQKDKGERNANIKQAAKDSNQANSNMQRAIDRDSSESNSNFSTSKKRFCEEVDPTDSACK